jgi:transposase
VWTESLTCVSDGFPNRDLFESLRDRHQGAGHAYRNDGAGLLIALEVFDAVQSSRGEPGRDDRKFLEAIHYFTVHSITWRALPKEFGNWNSVWKRFWRLSRSGVFEAFFQMLAECSETAHLMQFFDSTTARAHVSAAGAKGGSSIRPSAAHVAASRPKSTSRPISTAALSTFT